MDRISFWQRTLGQCVLAIGLGTMGILVSSQALADCTSYNPLGVPPPAQWNAPVRAMGGLMPAVYRPGSEHFTRTDFDGNNSNAGIVGLWRATFVSDGTAYPAPIPYGAVVDFGTVQWHSDGTELMVSGGRPPSSGDVCMGVWQQTGPRTYKLKHIALGWISSDTAPPLGPISPAVFVGPAIIRALVTLSPSHNSYEGSFTIDQYAADETTLLEHIGGKLSATRVTVD
jgi:hypothetical protein